MANKIHHSNREAGRPHNQKRWFQTVLYELAKEVNELYRNEVEDDNVHIIFGELWKECSNKANHSATSEEQSEIQLTKPTEPIPNPDQQATQVFKSLMDN